MQKPKRQISLLLNWYANPYHAPIIIAKEMGFYDASDIDLAILEPTNPSDVTKIVGKGQVQLGLKAMVHCYAARSRDYPIVSIGTLLEEPPTGLIFKKNSGIKKFSDIKGKKLGYVGEFGKVMIDDLAMAAGISDADYKTVRTGMNAAADICSGKVDAAIGISCFQQVEVEALSGACGMLRIDELADLGCCCFCSILFITQQKMVDQQPEVLKDFMLATRQGLDFTLANPEQTIALLLEKLPRLDPDLFGKIFVHTLPYFSRDLSNVARDWQKVGKYAERLGIVSEGYDSKQCYTDAFLPTSLASKDRLGRCVL